MDQVSRSSEKVTKQEGESHDSHNKGEMKADNIIASSSWKGLDNETKFLEIQSVKDDHIDTDQSTNTVVEDLSQSISSDVSEINSLLLNVDHDFEQQGDSNDTCVKSESDAPEKTTRRTDVREMEHDGQAMDNVSDIGDGEALEMCMIDDATPSKTVKKCKCKVKSKRHSEDNTVTVENTVSIPLHNMEESLAPTDAKKPKTGTIVTDSDGNEFVDAECDVVDDMESGRLASDKLPDGTSLKHSQQSSPSSSSSSPSSSSSSSSSDSDDIDQERIRKQKLERDADDELWLKKDVKDLPLPRWNAVKELRQRQCSSWNHYWPYGVCGCRAMVERFQLYTQLEKHDGCVNALHFNQTGTLLASGSDDLNIILWDWTTTSGHPVIEFDSGHRSNVFQAKFLPHCGDATVVSSARDGQVRVANISSTGTCHGTKKIAQHKGSAHKLSLDIDSKSSFLSCGEDGVVFGIDLRLDKPAEKLVTVKTDNRKIPLYSIHTNPSMPHEFAVSGRDCKAYVFDRRMIRDDTTPAMKTYCPHHLMDSSDMKANITCLVYNWDGTELLCSYNDEDIYLFDTRHSDGADYIKRYKGHRNNATVKGVNFYGPHSDFVVSGSDCGNVFFWEKESAQIVQLVDGDKGGVVNVLEPHPNLPVIATSGLDHEVKIWTPSSDLHEKANQMPKLREFMLSNRRDREEERRSMPDMIDGHMLWFLMRTLRSRRRRRAAERRERDDSSSDSDDNSSTSHSSSASSGEENGETGCIQS